MALVGMMTGKMHGMVGEDNADRDRMPDPEMLRFGRNSMSVTPLDPVRMAEGGNTRVIEPQVTIRPDVIGNVPGEQPVGDAPVNDIPQNQPPVFPPVCAFGRPLLGYGESRQEPDQAWILAHSQKRGRQKAERQSLLGPRGYD